MLFGYLFLDLGMCRLRKSPRWTSFLPFAGREVSQKSQSSSIIRLSFLSCLSSTQTLWLPQWWFRLSVLGSAPGLFEARLYFRARSLASAFA